MDLQRLAIEAGSGTFVAGDVEVGQEAHLDLLHALALARLAASGLALLKLNRPDFETPLLGLAGAGKDLANLVEDAGVGGRIAARRAADGRLVDLNDLVDLTGTAECREGSGHGSRVTQPPQQARGLASRSRANSCPSR